MFKKSTLYFVVLVVTLAGFARAEFLVNPGFEDPGPLNDTWITWGGGDGEGGWWETYNATVKQDGTAHSGNSYVEAGLVDPGWASWSWAGMWVWQEHPVIEGNTYQMSGWLRAADADGAATLIPEGAGVSLEWRYTAPVGGPTGQRGDEISRNIQLFDLTQDWTYVSIEATAPAGALGVSAGFFAGVGVNYDIDDASFMEVAPLPLVLNGSFEEDEAILDDPDWSQWCTWNPAEGAGSNVTIVDTDSVDGNRSLMIEPKGTEDWHFYVIYAPLPLEVGTNYTTTFWAKAAVPRPLGVTIKANDNSVSWTSTTFDLTTEWAEYSLSGVAENAEAKIDFACAATNDTIWLDNVSMVAEAATAPLILNGSFEEDEVIDLFEVDPEPYSGWALWYPAEGAGSTAAIDDTEFIDGARSLRIDPRGGVNWYCIPLHVDIPLEVGRDYTVEFWAKAAAPRPINAQLKAMDNSVTWSQNEFNLTTDWMKYSVSGAAMSDLAKLEFLCAATNDTIWLDHVELYAEDSGVVNLALNGSFEEDEPILDDSTWEAWATWYPSDVVGNNVMIVDTEAIDGSRSLQVDPKGTLIVANISWPLNMGSNATATFWAKAQSPRPLSASFKAADNSVSWGSKDFDLTTEWAEYSMTSAAQSNAGKLEFACGDSEVRFWLDNVTVTAEAEPAPLVTNGSFEDDFTGWWTWNPAEGGGTWTVIDTDSVDGDKSLRIDGLGTANWHYMVINTIPLEVGTVYTASLWARAEEPRSISVKLKADDNSVEWGNTDFDLTTEWAEYYFTAEALNALGKFEIHCGTSIPVYLDFVNVYEGEHDTSIAPLGSPNAGGASPGDGAIDVPRDVTLGWQPGNAAVMHDVYFGTDLDNVNNADITDATGIYRGSLDVAVTSYTPAESPLEWEQTYYWRIDEVNDADPNSPWKGNVWSFTIANYIVVDDFESYNDIEFDQDGSNLIYATWIDGYENPTANGAVVGYIEAFQPTMETDDVHGGNQSVPVEYDNSTARLSEVTRAINADWTQHDLLTLTLFYKGSLSNDPVPMYIALDGAAIAHVNPQAARAAGWNQWDILLQDFADLGVNLANVGSLTIGFGNKANPVVGGSGHVLVDDIRVSRSLPVQPETGAEPVDPGTGNLVASYSFEDNVQDGSGNGLDGVVVGNPFFVEGAVGKAIAFDGINDSVFLGDNPAFDITEQITISAWVKPNDAGDGQHNPYVSKGDHTYALKHASNNSIEFFIYDGGWYTANVSVDATFNDEWHHVLGTYDGLEVKTYVDGLLGATTAHTGTIAVQAHNLTIAVNSEETSRYYYGSVDEVKIYNRALSRGEVRFLVGN